MVVEFNRVLGNQELTLLSEQLKDLKRGGKTEGASMMMEMQMKPSETQMMSSTATNEPHSAKAGLTRDDDGTRKLIARLERRIAETVNRPASVALATIAYVEITIAPDAPPGPPRPRRTGTASSDAPRRVEPARLPRRPTARV